MTRRIAVVLHLACWTAAALAAALPGCTRAGDDAAEARISGARVIDSAPHRSAFVTANGVRLNYLDWGGTGPVLVLVHGFGCSPHYFDRLAAALSGEYHVVAYARRGHGESEVTPPYDMRTLAEDLRQLMDSLGIARAAIGGMSMGGNEVTAMATFHPDRVEKIIYFDAAYEWGDWLKALGEYPIAWRLGGEQLASFDTYRDAMGAVLYPRGYQDGAEADMRGTVLDNPDGSVRVVADDSVFAQVQRAMSQERRAYERIQVPALAIYAHDWLPAAGYPDSTQRKVDRWSEAYYRPFKAAQMDRLQAELAGVEIIEVPGTHMDFIWTSHDRVVAEVRRFLAQ